MPFRLSAHKHHWLVRACGMLLGMIVVGCALGLFLTWMMEREAFMAWIEGGIFNLSRSKPPLDKMLISTVYTVIMWSTLLGVKKLAYRWIPLNSLWHLAAHISLITVSSVVMFAFIQEMDRLVCTWVKGAPADAPDLGTSMTVTFVMVALISTFTYAFDFYRGMRDAQQAGLESELKALRAQINPHFLFNTLNSIAALVSIKPDEAESVTEKLANLFRYSLQASKHPTVTLAEEIEATRMYIDIEQARFRERLQVDVAIAPEISNAQVPSLLIQPLVENAVKHGVAQMEEPCLIRVKATPTESNRIHLEVHDTGPGFASTDPTVIFARGTGLANVRDRLQLLFGEQASLTLLSDGVAIYFPYRTAGTARAKSHRRSPRKPHRIARDRHTIPPMS